MEEVDKVDILSAVDKLEADTIALRTKGLEELRRILGQRLDPSRIDVIRDNGFHQILESLFRMAKGEKSNYYRASTATSKNRATSRLTTVAAAIRLVVELATPKLKYKTANAVLDHIVDTLPGPEEEFCIPIQHDYLKSFHTLLEYQPIGEHLRPKQWQAYVDFALQGISMSLDDESPPFSSFNGDTNVSSRYGLNVSVRVSQSSNKRNHRPENNASTDDLVGILKALTSITNSPLSTRMTTIVDVLLSHLEKSTRSYEVIFETLNNILPTALTEDLNMAVGMLVRSLPLIRRLWSLRSSDLRDQILSMLLIGQPVLKSSLFLHQLLNQNILEQTTDTILSDYEGRLDREILLFDDIQFVDYTNENGPGMQYFVPLSSSPRAMSNWAALSIIATLLLALDQSHQLRETSKVQEGPNKRRKIESNVSDHLERAANPGSPHRVAILQVSLFLIDQAENLPTEMVQHVPRLTQFVAEDDPQVSAWSLMLLARFASRYATSSHEHMNWEEIWVASSRALTNTATARAASHFMRTIIEQGLYSSFLSAQVLSESIFPSGTSGPSGLTDSAILLMCHALLSNLLDTEKAFENFTNRMLSWLDANWILSPVLDRSQASQLAQQALPQYLYKVLSLAAGKSSSQNSSSPGGSSNAIHKAYCVSAENKGFLNLLLQPVSIRFKASGISGSSNNQASVATYASTRLSTAVSELLISKLKTFRSSWIALSTERSSNINQDVAKIMAGLCTVVCCVFQLLEPSNLGNSTERLLNTAWQGLCDHVFDKEASGSRITAAMLASYTLQISSTNSVEEAGLCRARHKIIASLLNILQQPVESQMNDAILDVEFLDSTEVLQSQGSQERSQRAETDVGRQDQQLVFNTRARTSKATLLLLIDSLKGNEKPEVDPAAIVVDHIVSLNGEDLLYVRAEVVKFLNDNTGLPRATACILLKRIGAMCLEDDNLERCEASLCFCLRVMTILTPIWASNEIDDLSNVAYDIYSWYLDVALEKGVGSERVLLNIAVMLEAVFRCNASYACDNLPSPRTSLLKILSEGQVKLKYEIGPKLSCLFHGYVLTEHAAVFDDIVDSLPTDPDGREGIAVRLFVLSTLGAQWHTVLRQAIYHIFETTANVPATSTVAAACLDRMCKTLGEEAPRKLLQLFSPQILYTWLRNEVLETMPFTAFGYRSLHDLVKDLEEEIVAQVAMRASHNHVLKLENILGARWEDLLVKHFPKVAAYVIATDVAVNKSGSSNGQLESLLCDQLGADLYFSLTADHLPNIIAKVFVSLSDDRGFEKAFSGSDVRNPPATAYQEMLQRSSSETQLPGRQQPSFRAKYVLQILSKLCQESKVDMTVVWKPAVLIHVYRSLFDDISAAFGSLHTAAVVRKVRLVVSLAGPSALQGYPLEMLLHNLRPFLTKFHCAEDASGIFWYLVHNGKQYLETKIPFITGLSVTIFTSLTRFVTSSQESTTQDSHFKSTMSKAQELRTWLGAFLSSLQSTSLAKDAIGTFRDIVLYAKSITGCGSNTRSSAEGCLLYHLLHDRTLELPLLAQTFFDLSVQALSYEFQVDVNTEEDILANSNDAVRFAPVLLSILRRLSPGESFRIWAAQSFGRAYAAAGPEAVSISVHNGPFTELITAPRCDGQETFSKIVRALFRLLWEGDSKAASSAEKTLQRIISSIPTIDRLSTFGSCLDDQFITDLDLESFQYPTISFERRVLAAANLELLQVECATNDISDWASDVAVVICSQTATDTLPKALVPMVMTVKAFSCELLPALVHVVLLSELDGKQAVREKLSSVFSQVLELDDAYVKPHKKLILQTLLYLRSCELPGESTIAKRCTWLDVDMALAAQAALHCHMPHAALLLMEVHAAQHYLLSNRTSRRLSVAIPTQSSDLLTLIYQEVDDADFFYGNHEETDLTSVIEKLRHEGMGYKTLAFQSAVFDSSIKSEGFGPASFSMSKGISSALDIANFHGLSSAVRQFTGASAGSDISTKYPDTLLNTHQWDLWRDDGNMSGSGPILQALRSLSKASCKEQVVASSDSSLLSVIDHIIHHTLDKESNVRQLENLAVLSEIKGITTITAPDNDVEDVWGGVILSNDWAKQESFDAISGVLLGREATAAVIRRNDHIRVLLGISSRQALLSEVKLLRSSLKLGHIHEASQFCLSRTSYLAALGDSASKIGLKVEAAVQYDLANTLWTQEEIAAPIKILQRLSERNDLSEQSIKISRAEILTDLGQKATQARLDRPDEVTTNYLVPAIQALGKHTTGPEAGHVFHNFATFCDTQLKDTANNDDFARVEKIRNRKYEELVDLDRMLKRSEGKTKDQVKMHYSKAKTWFKLDDEVYQRMKTNQETLIQRCLENYLLSLQASDEYPSDVLRFLALWLSHASHSEASVYVEKHISGVPTLKFAPLMNQLSSRIMDDNTSRFQRVLFDLMFRICCDHPFHSLYQLFATSKSKGQKNDDVANSRHNAANRLAQLVEKKGPSRYIWISIHNSNIAFVRLAQERIPDKEAKTGSKIQLRSLPQGFRLEQAVRDLNQKIPPPTMNIGLQPDRVYSSVPTFSTFDPLLSIAGGVSAPKIVTVTATDGSRHKMLLKGGNDDLRQDSIMEQVFEQVSDLLRDHKATRQRKLAIRTYKVIPLTHNAGIIEFVKDTVPLHDYLLPAHLRYFPKDFKPNKCRKEIADAQTKPLTQRIQAYRSVVASFHPVMRFFFMERYLDPDDWFQKRLNYSHSTAAVSILGHVLGLGDRHGHNILLDEHSGEVVHIDLGVAFEAGRVLPVPEVVPFRLTRDLVDGMGISGVEGPFRRCCQFTLEALRQNEEAIMTILDVLRWDPLHSWTVSPLRLQRMQENQEQVADESAAQSTSDTTRSTTLSRVGGATVAKRDLNEPSEADRALTVVAQKLGKSLSVEATVNELIRQATDDRNLAVLYCGWAAYA